MSTQSRSLRFADQLSRSPFVWPGGYPLVAVTNDGACLCHRCTESERESIGTTTGTDGWTIVGLQVNWEDSQLLCDHCSTRIEAACA